MREKRNLASGRRGQGACIREKRTGGVKPDNTCITGWVKKEEIENLHLGFLGHLFGVLDRWSPVCKYKYYYLYGKHALHAVQRQKYFYF